MKRILVLIFVFCLFPSLIFASGLVFSSGGAGYTELSDCSAIITLNYGCYNYVTKDFCIGNGITCVVYVPPSNHILVNGYTLTVNGDAVIAD